MTPEDRAKQAISFQKQDDGNWTVSVQGSEEGVRLVVPPTEVLINEEKSARFFAHALRRIMASLIREAIKNKDSQSYVGWGYEDQEDLDCDESAKTFINNWSS